MSAIWVYILVITLVTPILPMVGNMRISNLEGILPVPSFYIRPCCISCTIYTELIKLNYNNLAFCNNKQTAMWAQLLPLQLFNCTKTSSARAPIMHLKKKTFFYDLCFFQIRQYTTIIYFAAPCTGIIQLFSSHDRRLYKGIVGLLLYLGTQVTRILSIYKSDIVVRGFHFLSLSLGAARWNAALLYY